MFIYTVKKQKLKTSLKNPQRDFNERPKIRPSINLIKELHWLPVRHRITYIFF